MEATKKVRYNFEVVLLKVTDEGDFFFYLAKLESKFKDLGVMY